MKIARSLLLMFFLFGSPVMLHASQPSFSKIIIHDDSALKKNDLVNRFISQDFSADRIDNLMHEVLRYYQQNGYLMCRIDSAVALIDSAQASVILDVYVNEGPVFILRDMVFTGGQLPASAEEQAYIDPGKGEVFAESRITAAVENVLVTAENAGYPLMKVLVDSVQTQISDSRGEVVLKMQAQPGPRITIDEIRFQGNQITRDQVLFREIGIKIGELYNQEKISLIPERLMRLGYLRSVRMPQLFFTRKGGTGLLVTVAENQANTFDGVVGYSPETQTQPGYFTGRFDLQLGNLMGTGRQITALWQKLDRSSQNLALGYLEPWVGGWPVNAGFEFQQRIQDSSYVDRSFKLTARTPVGSHFAVFGAVSLRSVLPDSTGIIRYNLPNSSEQSFSLGIEYDNRDNFLNPRRGFRYQIAFDYGRKKNTIPDGYDIDALAGRQTIRRLEMDLQTLFTVFNNQVLSVGLYARQLTGDTDVFPISELYRLGGAGNLRGFREDQFRGSLTGWGNIEYRYLLGPRSRAFVFSDWGYHGRYLESDNWSDRIENSFGFGLRLETGVGVFGIDYGLASGNSFSEGMIHVRLVNFF